MPLVAQGKFHIEDISTIFLVPDTYILFVIHCLLILIANISQCNFNSREYRRINTAAGPQASAGSYVATQGILSNEILSLSSFLFLSFSIYNFAYVALVVPTNIIYYVL